MEVSLTSWILATLAAFVIGMSKAGIKGIAVINVTFMALAFGAKESTGMVVPLLILADIFAVIYYNRHTQWSYVFKVLPWMVFGLVIGVFIGKDLPESLFRIGMAVIIIITVFMMYWWDRKKIKTVPTHWTFSSSIGTLAGITTMVGNLAGAFSNIYFLAMRLPKNHFIGTAAWLFLIINVLKLPFHFFVWETITWESLVLNVKLLPGIFLGFFVGIRIIKLINEEFFRKMILVLTALGALLIMVG
ncbi:sulfite exporter TauE/SafE family protein [Maribacter sp. PR1]|uniref:Probable membrane transporter protein n=1 Tax=Maribacter cobaltidurans TaxID=1178778 RepID=A0ABU7IR23_9FLAO|nr:MULTISPECIES: sulfite exporter TauE/SafE family protein [Maribacter]MDC6387925.1 sulfite exporter TauE/SafE family protein [Maribacter sp. PR1]MEE1975314.1 sulfite exporter TauE/SafE family protein [Maribacter cobaltidurans]